jgi:hypothetical protein
MSYDARFPVGTRIRIAAEDRLRAFQRDWKYHHPLTPDQIPFGGTTDVVRSVSYYHGGDVLYDLEQAPGIWHEELLEIP